MSPSPSLPDPEKCAGMEDIELSEARDFVAPLSPLPHLSRPESLGISTAVSRMCSDY
jgi:hypothetical protein